MNSLVCKALVAILDASESEFDLHLFFSYKSRIAAHCLLQEDFSGNIAMFNVYK